MAAKSTDRHFASSSSSFSTPAPKILLAKPSPSSPSSFSVSKDDSSSRSRSSSLGSLNLLSVDSWELNTDRALPFLSDNTDFTVIGIIGPPGVGKSTIINELYGFDGNSPGMLPSFATQTEETKAMARHRTNGIEMRVSAERLILLDTQPIFSSSILAEMMKSDGSSSIPIVDGDYVPAVLAHEIMGIQLGVFLSSICHVLLVVSEGIHDISSWHLMSTVDLLKHNIPDPSLLSSGNTQSTAPILDNEFLSMPIFVHTKLQQHQLSSSSVNAFRKTLSQYFAHSSFCTKRKSSNSVKDSVTSLDSAPPLFMLPLDVVAGSSNLGYESFSLALERLRDKILSLQHQSFERTISEREWARNASKIWAIVKKSPTMAEFFKTLKYPRIFKRS
ncbi:Protein SMG9 [Zostera marina]|uniref:Protein SMG9 n=1 Tax=Zostera marina TaxID=29655 RepID=A0A0K9Q090_ZOSMR|nr:Protein SMG9 [Zostera marina]